jgi:hypothetical protein
MDLEKRDRRQLKREIKRKGTQHRRRLLKRGLAEHPEEAIDDIPTVGRFRSSDFNGLDRDLTRRKAKRTRPESSP